MTLESHIGLIEPFLTVADMKVVVQLNKYINGKIQPKLYEQGVVSWEHRGKFCKIKICENLSLKLSDFGVRNFRTQHYIYY